MPLLRVKRHMATISLDQAERVWPSCNKLRQAGLAQLMHGAQETRDQGLALPAGAMLLQEQVAEPLLEAVDEFQDGFFSYRPPAGAVAWGADNGGAAAAATAHRDSCHWTDRGHASTPGSDD